MGAIWKLYPEMVREGIRAKHQGWESEKHRCVKITKKPQWIHLPFNRRSVWYLTTLIELLAPLEQETGVLWGLAGTTKWGHVFFPDKSKAGSHLWHPSASINLHPKLSSLSKESFWYEPEKMWFASQKVTVPTKVDLRTFVSWGHLSPCLDDSPGETASRSQANQTAVGQSPRHITTWLGHRLY